MKRVQRITESQISRLVNLVINEKVQFEEWVKLNSSTAPKITMTTEGGVNVLDSVKIEGTNTVVINLKPGKYKPGEVINVEVTFNSGFQLTNSINQKTPMMRPVSEGNKISFSFKMSRTNIISKALSKIDKLDIFDKDDNNYKNKSDNEYGSTKVNFSVGCKNIIEGKINILVKGSEEDEVIVKQ